MAGRISRLKPAREPMPILTEWGNVETGKPVILDVWRGAGGPRPSLQPHHRECLGRDQLLGAGLYVAPTRHMARKYGYPLHLQAVLYNPYAVRLAPQWGWLWSFKQLDLAAIAAAGHDGIVVIEGKTPYREDLRQAVIFPPFVAQVTPWPRTRKAPALRYCEGLDVPGFGQF